MTSDGIATPTVPIVCLLDNDAETCHALARLLRSTGYTVATFTSAAEFLSRDFGSLADVCLPHLTGLDLLGMLRAARRQIPIVFVAGVGDGSTSVQATKAGAERRELSQRLTSLTPREREVFLLVVSGLLNKQIAGRLGTTQQTVKVHRGRVMQKMHANSLAQLVHFAEQLGLLTPESHSHAAMLEPLAWRAAGGGDMY